MKKILSMVLALLFCISIMPVATAEMPVRTAYIESKSTSSIARQIVRSCTTSDMTQYQKAVALYDWLIDNTVYKKGTTNAHTVLSRGYGSCGGYANAYTVLLNKVGIKSKFRTGRYLTLDHAWNQVRLDGKWYHVDVRLGDHMEPSEGRYRRFGMSDEQAKLYYKFKGSRAKSYVGNYAYKTGKLDSAITYVRNALTTRVEAGEHLFVIDLTAEGAPPELADPFNRITVKNALKKDLFNYPGIPDQVKAALSLYSTNSMLLVDVKIPTYRIKNLTVSGDTAIVIEVENDNFSALAPLDLGNRISIVPDHATNKTLYWNSSKEKIAVVSQSGKVTVKGYGKTIIKAATTDRSKLKRSFTLHIKPKQDVSAA